VRGPADQYCVLGVIATLSNLDVDNTYNAGRCPCWGNGNTSARALTSDTPKGPVDVAGAPIFSHCFDRLTTLGIDEIVVVVGYAGQ